MIEQPGSLVFAFFKLEQLQRKKSMTLLSLWQPGETEFILSLYDYYACGNLFMKPPFLP